MVFSSFVIGLRQDVGWNSMSTWDRWDSIESIERLSVQCIDLLTTNEQTPSKGLEVNYALPLPDW